VPTSNTYAHEASRPLTVPVPLHERIRVLVGVLEALREDVKAGWLTTVEELLHADTFADFLDRARELSSKGLQGRSRCHCRHRLGVPPTATV
jgi:hypothetical protein